MNTLFKNLVNEIEKLESESLTKDEIITLIKQFSASKTLPVLISNDVIIDPNKYTVNKTVLPKTEFKLLHYLVSNPNICLKRDEIITNVWGTDIWVCDRTIDVHIRKLRQKLTANCIQTFKRIGYMWVEN